MTGVQVLDGIFGVVSVLVVADLTKGTGRFNLVNGVLITAVGLGASFSNAVAGWLADRFSFRIAFVFLAAVAALALLLYFLFMKETRREDDKGVNPEPGKVGPQPVL